MVALTGAAFAEVTVGASLSKRDRSALRVSSKGQFDNGEAAEPLAGRATQERTLGAILGLGIGDALGMPATGLTQKEVQAAFGRIDGYHGRRFDDGAELAPGEFTDETEIALCIMETYTSANGQLEPELIRARMQFLARGESRRWMSSETLRSLEDDEEPWYRSDRDDDPEVALRGIPIGLIHATPNIDRPALYRDVETVVALTHRNPASVDQAALVATAVARVLAGTVEQPSLFAELAQHTSNRQLLAALERGQTRLAEGASFDSFARGNETGNAAIDAIMSGLSAFVTAARFEDAAFAAASAGGNADSRTALAGSLAGAHFGAGGIPQPLIDQLEGRIYLTLAAPWFYRTIQLMTGRGISISANGR